MSGNSEDVVNNSQSIDQQIEGLLVQQISSMSTSTSASATTSQTNEVSQQQQVQEQHYFRSATNASTITTATESVQSLFSSEVSVLQRYMCVMNNF